MTYLQELALSPKKKDLPVSAPTEPDKLRDNAGKRERVRELTDHDEGTSHSRGGQKFDRAEYQREYMREWRKKKKKCPHCGKEI